MISSYPFLILDKTKILIHKENVDTRVESKHTVPVIDHTRQTDVHFFSRKIQSIWSEIIRITLVTICLMSVCGGWSCLTSGTWHGVSHDPRWRLPWNSSYGHTPRIHKITYKNKIRSELQSFRYYKMIFTINLEIFNVDECNVNLHVLCIRKKEFSWKLINNKKKKVTKNFAKSWSLFHTTVYMNRCQ